LLVNKSAREAKRKKANCCFVCACKLFQKLWKKRKLCSRQKEWAAAAASQNFFFISTVSSSENGKSKRLKK
jgi:hypothetical protein